MPDVQAPKKTPAPSPIPESPPAKTKSPPLMEFSFDPSDAKSYYTYMAAGYGGTATGGGGLNHHGFAAAAGGGMRVSFSPYGNYHGLAGLFLQRAGLSATMERPGGQSKVASDATTRSLGLELGFQFTPAPGWFSASALGAVGLVHYSALAAGSNGSPDAPQGLVFGENQEPHGVDAFGTHMGITLQGNVWKDIFLVRAGLAGHLGVNPEVEFSEGTSQILPANFSQLTLMAGVNVLSMISQF